MNECLSIKERGGNSINPVGSHNTNPWATLAISRHSVEEPWNLDVHQRNALVYLNPLPAELLEGSVVARYFLGNDSLASSRAVRVVSVNGAPAVSSSKVRRELNRSSTVVFQLVMQATAYRRALNKQRKEEREVRKDETDLNTADEPLSLEFEDEHTPEDADVMSPADELYDVHAVEVEAPSAAGNSDDDAVNTPSETVTAVRTPADVAPDEMSLHDVSPPHSDDSLGLSDIDGAATEEANPSEASPAKVSRKTAPRKLKSKKNKKKSSKAKKPSAKQKANRVAVSKAAPRVDEISVSL